MSAFQAISLLRQLSPDAKALYLAQVNAIIYKLPDHESWNSRRTALYQYAIHTGKEREFWLKFLNSFSKLYGASADLSDVIALIDEARPQAPATRKSSSTCSSAEVR